MVVGRSPTARAVADEARLTSADRVVDLGCGTGTAVRTAARRAANAVGVDPTRAMLRVAQWTTQGLPNAGYIEGTAESVPLPDGEATVVWAIRSVHHWADRAAGLAEARRAAGTGGRLLLCERVVGTEGAPGGLSAEGLDRLADDVARAGFTGAHQVEVPAGRRVYTVIEAVR